MPGPIACIGFVALIASTLSPTAKLDSLQPDYLWTPFAEVRRPAVPHSVTVAFNPIDSFLGREQQARGLHPRPEGSKPVLLRRVYLDLTGLPPSREELHAFLADQTPDAYEKIVERLLASPAYGERWARHWMDIWRYSDWAGFGMEVRDSQPFIWRWRDWIVQSLRQDLGYDRMIMAMLAGDELAPTDPDTLRATGFLVRNWYKFSRDTWLQNTVEHTAKAFLGVTLNCARCHEHKYDPFEQEDYYRFRAFFETLDIRTDAVAGQPDTKKDGLVRVYDAHLDRPTYLYVRGDEKLPRKEDPLPPAVPDSLGGPDLRIEPIVVPAPAAPPPKGTDYPKTSTGRRLALARWIVDRRNPLTARVAMNHVWLRHFGQPLVQTVFDFGANGKPASHPALLDWLASEFMARGWSFKAMHKLIVTSRAYRQDSSNDPRAVAIDPDNVYLWRMKPWRMEAECVRDGVLFVSGSLDRTMGGPDLPQQKDMEICRRSLYFTQAAEKQALFLSIFDGPSVTECYQRSQSILPQQALAMANSPLVAQHSGRLAKSLTDELGSADEQFLQAAFERVLSRGPTERERQVCAAYVAERNRMSPAPGTLKIRQSLIQVLLNHHEFISIR
jgi:Protein of unknown function (DUF1553)/Protein of unknown function (DUF1549)